MNSGRCGYIVDSATELCPWISLNFLISCDCTQIVNFYRFPRCLEFSLPLKFFLLSFLNLYLIWLHFMCSVVVRECFNCDWAPSCSIRLAPLYIFANQTDKWHPRCYTCCWLNFNRHLDSVDWKVLWPVLEMNGVFAENIQIFLRYLLAHQSKTKPNYEIKLEAKLKNR